MLETISQSIPIVARTATTCAVAVDLRTSLRRQAPPGLGGHERPLATALLQHARDQPLGMAVAVDVGGIDEVQARIERRMQRRHRLVIVHPAPGRADGPGPESDLANGAAGAAEGSGLHAVLRLLWLPAASAPP